MRGWLNWLTAHDRQVRLILLAFIAVLVGLAWSRHDTFQPAASYSSTEPVPYACASGFLLRENPRVFVFRDWQGLERWRAQCPPPGIYRSPFYGISSWDGSASLSPNGHVLAKVAIVNGKLLIYTWQDGHPDSPVTLPPYRQSCGFPDIHLVAQDDGSVLYWEGEGPPFHLARYYHGRLLASGILKGYPHIYRGLPGLPHQGGYAKVADDGLSAVCTGPGRWMGVYQLTTHGTDITATRLTVLPYDEESWQYTLLQANGRMIAVDGTVYQQGKPVGSIERYLGTSQAAYGEDSSGEWLFTHWLGDGTARNLATGARWSVRIPGAHGKNSCYADGILSATLSTNGRFALVDVQEQAASELRRRLSAFPLLQRWLPEDAGWRDYLALYERPGHCVARFTRDYAHWVPHASVNGTTAWAIAPDGRHVLAMVEYNDGEKLSYRAILLQRGW